MSNRMSVLSRRLERYAVGFSIAAFAFFGIGLYVSSKPEGQLVFLFAGLVLVCLFASFFLWLSHGFAWAMIPEKPQEAKKPAEALKPEEVLKPEEAVKPTEPMKPAEAMKAAEEKKPEEEKVIAPKDPPDAKYTITGRRVY